MWKAITNDNGEAVISIKELRSTLSIPLGSYLSFLIQEQSNAGRTIFQSSALRYRL